MAALAPRIPAVRYISLIALLAATQWCRAGGIEALERRLNSDGFGLRCNTGETIAASARLSPTAVAPYDPGMIARAKMSKMIADVPTRHSLYVRRRAGTSALERHACGCHDRAYVVRRQVSDALMARRRRGQEDRWKSEEHR
jgi:hypothetical protein